MSVLTARTAEILPSIKIMAPIGEDAVGLGGLRTSSGQAFPLKRVKVRASLAGPCARTVVEQQFQNPFDEVLDVTWIFPLPSDGAIVELELVAGEVRVTGECLERGQAKATFDSARQLGKRAALMEKEMSNVYTLSLTGLPARSDVTVRFVLVQLLPSIDGCFRWHFPTTIAPRYTPGATIDHAGFGTAADTDAVPNASRLSPPIRLSGGTELDLEADIAGPLTALESSLHAISLSMDHGVVRVAPSAVTTLNKDFILAFSTAGRGAAVVPRAWTDGVHTLVLVEPPENDDTPALPRDAVFTVDISGSMQGRCLDAAKLALRGALHGLRTGDRFKLIAFDDHLEYFSHDFATYDDRNLMAADGWIEALQARGGTEMLPAIVESLAGATPKGRLRTVLFITDGQSNDEARLLPAVANRKGEAVFFTLGIDTAVNEGLLTSLARAGGGVCELCTPYDNIDTVIARLENRFGTPLLSHLTVPGAARPDGQTVFAGRPASVMIEGAPSTVSVTATGATGPFEQRVVPVPVAFKLGELWAMERVAYLEERLTLRPFEEEAIRPEILRVALQGQIASKFTSFVCVDHSTASEGERRHVVQPTELPDAWELPEQDVAAFGGSMPCPAPVQVGRARWSMPANFSLSHAMPALRGRAENDAPEDAPQAASGNASAPAFETTSYPELDSAGVLVRSQGADGSFGGDVGRTAAALLVLLMLGHTRRSGDRRRTVQKTVAWLRAHAGDRRAGMALAALEVAEQTHVTALAEWRSLSGEGAEGAMLEGLLDSHSV
jgi:Ca-activated chloride channel family protein